MNQSLPIYHKHTLEFATVAKEYCAFLEQAQGMAKSEFVDKSLKLLPLIYLKTTLLPTTEYSLEEETEKYVSEEHYEYLRSYISAIMGKDDTYLEVFTADMEYSEHPIQENVSEGIADIYQDLRDFIHVFSMAYEETMNDVLALVQDNFRSYWGQKLLNVLRQLHFTAYNTNDDETMEFYERNAKDSQQNNWLFEGQKDDEDSQDWEPWT